MQLLFGLAVICSAVSLAFALMLHQVKWAVWPLIWTVAIGWCSVVGIIVLGFLGAVDAAYIPAALINYTDVILAHRWLVLQLPLVALPTVFSILIIYRDRLVSKQADVYHRAVLLGCTGTLFATLVAAAEWSI